MTQQYKRFLILSSPRSGSHMIRTSLGSHSDIKSMAEMFNPDWIKDSPYDKNTSEEVTLERHIFRKYPPNIRTVASALHWSGVRFGNWKNLWNRYSSLFRRPEIMIFENEILLFF